MKPLLDRLVIVSATINPERAMPCFESWAKRAHYAIHQIIVWNGAFDAGAVKAKDVHLYQTWAPEFDALHPAGTYLARPEILGVVPAFALGVGAALKMGAEIIACFHDDLEILEDGWDLRVLETFDRTPSVGLAGFGGGTGLGSDDIYQTPYSPHQLARQGFISNMVDAEAHGTRVERVQPVACLDGFSQIGRAKFWVGAGQQTRDVYVRPELEADKNLFAEMQAKGITHHFYDGLLGIYAHKLGWDARMIPVKVKHLGGQTAVGEARYTEWAHAQTPGGDQDFWETAHRIGYTEGRGILPIRV